MFDSLPDAEDERAAEDREESSSAWRWAHFPAFLIFGLLLLLSKGHWWSWYVAIGGGSSVFVFWIAFGSSLKDSDDFFGNSAVPEYAAKLLIPHSLALAFVLAAVYFWFHLQPNLPEWVIHEGRKGSLWDLLGWLALGGAGIIEGLWMAGKVRRRFRVSEDDS